MFLTNLRISHSEGALATEESHAKTREIFTSLHSVQDDFIVFDAPKLQKLNGIAFNGRLTILNVSHQLSYRFFFASLSMIRGFSYFSNVFKLNSSTRYIQFGGFLSEHLLMILNSLTTPSPTIKLSIS